MEALEALVKVAKYKYQTEKDIIEDMKAKKNKAKVAVAEAKIAEEIAEAKRSNPEFNAQKAEFDKYQREIQNG
jgi:hypothetical protein